MRTLKNPRGPIVPGRFRGPIDPSRTFSTLAEVVAFETEFRKANDLLVPADLQQQIEDWLCNQIPDAWQYCKEDGRRMVPDVDGRRVYGNGYQGQAKWRQLHEWALTGNINIAARAEFLDAFAGSLPCGECRRKWKALVKENPAPLNGLPSALFKWSYERHRDVRERLGQPLISFEEAVALYTEEAAA